MWLSGLCTIAINQKDGSPPLRFTLLIQAESKDREPLK